MRAVAFSHYGAADVLEIIEVAKPSLRPNDILVRNIAAGINPTESIFRSGQFRLILRLKLPFVPGSDIAGVVEAVGSNVTRFQPGDAVSAMLPTPKGGGYAEYVAVDADSAAAKPSSLSFVEAAALPLVGLTALQALRDQAQLQPGDHILINGASGGVGHVAVQIAKAMGAQVTATCSTANVELVRSLGADRIIDYKQEDVTAGKEQYAIIFDAVGVYPFERWRRALLPKGRLVTVNLLFGNPLNRALSRLTGAQRLLAVAVQPSGSDLEQLNAWVASGQLHPHIDQAYPLSEAVSATEYSESKRVRGKLVLIVDEAFARLKSA